MPELGKYTFVVLSSYGATLLLLGVLVSYSVWRGAVMRRRLAKLEGRRTSDG